MFILTSSTSSQFTKKNNLVVLPTEHAIPKGKNKKKEIACLLVEHTSSIKLQTNENNINNSNMGNKYITCS